MSKRFVAIIVARQGSKRLPGKALLKINNKPIISLIIERLKNISIIDQICVATSNKDIDKPIIDLAKKEKVLFYSGSPEDVLDRLYKSAYHSKAEIIYEVGGDCPFVDEKTIIKGYNLLQEYGYDFVHNFPPSTYPDGLDCPIMTFKCLEKMHEKAILSSNRMHPFSYIFTYPEYFKVGNFDYFQVANDIRLTLDYKEDFTLISKIFNSLYSKNINFSLDDIVGFLRKNPKLISINEKYIEPLSPEPYWNTLAFINDLHNDLFMLTKKIKDLNNRGLRKLNDKNYDEVIRITKLLKKRAEFSSGL